MLFILLCCTIIYQAEVLRSADGVYTVEKNEEIKLVSS